MIIMEYNSVHISTSPSCPAYSLRSASMQPRTEIRKFIDTILFTNDYIIRRIAVLRSRAGRRSNRCAAGAKIDPSKTDRKTATSDCWGAGGWGREGIGREGESRSTLRGPRKSR